MRPARPGDVPCIAAIHVETWRSTYAGLLPDSVLLGLSQSRCEAMWRPLFARGGSDERVLVATADDEGPVGFASFGRARWSAFAGAGPHVGEVFTLYVLPDYQGRGLGRHLLHACFRRLVDGGMPSAVIWTLAFNPSRFFYEAMGGERVAEREEALWGTLLPQTAYAWTDLRRALRRVDFV